METARPLHNVYSGNKVLVVVWMVRYVFRSNSNNASISRPMTDMRDFLM
jgi:hypothetical protein